MKDLREYKETLKAAVARERDNDANWGWNIQTVNKNTAKIGWGYLDYIGETDKFTLEIFDEDACLCVIGTVPDGYKIHVFIGPNHWDDAKTIEDGIAAAIHSIAGYAKSTY